MLLVAGVVVFLILPGPQVLPLVLKICGLIAAVGVGTIAAATIGRRNRAGDINEVRVPR